MASRKNVTEPPDPIDPDHQAALIIANFATWLAQRSGRRIVLSHDGTTWQCDLEERRSTHGRTLQDATAQGAQVAAAEVEQ
jgi:hypothetical protein